MSTAEAQLPPPLIARGDFPTWLPAMLVKELRQGLRARGFVGALILYQVVMTLIVLFSMADAAGSFSALQTTYWTVLGVVLLIVTPLRAISGLQTEIESRSIDLLLVTRLNAWRIVAGKWLSLLVQALLLVVASLPYGIARYFFGSVDLVADAEILAAMLGGCALLTAAALWASGLPKWMRVVVAVAVGIFFQATSMSFFMLGRAGAAPSPFYFLRGASYGLIVFNGALWFGVCLIGAVRRLAPPAVNLSPYLRVLPLVGFLSLPFLSNVTASGELAALGLLTAVVAVMEFNRATGPMPGHWRPWARLGGYGRWLGRLAMPGWGSALEWMLVMLAVGLVLAGIARDSRHYIQLLATGAEALVLPAVATSFFRPGFPNRAAVYGLILGVGSLISAFAAGMASSLPMADVADTLLLMLPISGFWWSISGTNVASDGALTLQLLVALTVFGLGWWRAEPQREEIRRLARLPAAS